MRLLLLLCLVALAGCAGRGAPEPELSAFERRLGLLYERLALAEFEEGDFADGRLFRAKARAALAGGSPPPDPLDVRILPPEVRPVAEDALARLTAAFDTAAPLVAAEDLAAAQTEFDCWVQEAEENDQPEQVEACRGAFFATLARVEAAASADLVVLLPGKGEAAASGAIDVASPGGAVSLDAPFTGAGQGADAAADLEPKQVQRTLANALAVEPAEPRAYLLYFETGGSVLTPEGERAFAAALADAAATDAARLTVFGHTDRVGSAALNTRIAQSRARAIVARLIEAGITAQNIAAESFGESRSLVPTADGVAEAQNRRVEIVVR
ncbi:MAG: OmpA family protein [Pseudomonadota bacterium]